VGSGPAGFYTADKLLKLADSSATVDIVVRHTRDALSRHLRAARRLHTSSGVGVEPAGRTPSHQREEHGKARSQRILAAEV
jgi:hypothetical protein